MFDLIAFDADDTLWDNEALYHAAQEKLRRLLAPYASAEQVDQTLRDVEARNLELFGYGIKGFTLSMVEAAIEVSGGRIPADEVRQIVGFGRDMIRAGVRLLPGVEETLLRLAGAYSLMLITKGDLLDQQRKIARSGLERYFDAVEIVSEKDTETYARLLNRYGVPPARFLMVGNSLRSDVLPVIALGGEAVYIPHTLTWAHEAALPPERGAKGYHQIEHIGLLPALLSGLNSRRLAGDGSPGGPRP